MKVWKCLYSFKSNVEEITNPAEIINRHLTLIEQTIESSNIPSSLKIKPSVTSQDRSLATIGHIVDILNLWFNLLSKEKNKKTILVNKFKELQQRLSQTSGPIPPTKIEKDLTTILRILISKKKYNDFLEKGFTDTIKILLNLHQKQPYDAQNDIMLPYTGGLYSLIDVSRLTNSISFNQSYLENHKSIIQDTNKFLLSLIQHKNIQPHNTIKPNNAKKDTKNARIIHAIHSKESDDKNQNLKIEVNSAPEQTFSQKNLGAIGIAMIIFAVIAVVSTAVIVLFLIIRPRKTVSSESNSSQTRYISFN